MILSTSKYIKKHILSLLGERGTFAQTVSILIYFTLGSSCIIPLHNMFDFFNKVTSDDFSHSTSNSSSKSTSNIFATRCRMVLFCDYSCAEVYYSTLKVILYLIFFLNWRYSCSCGHLIE